MACEERKLYGLDRLRETLVVAEATAKTMRANRSEETGLELRLRRALWAAGLRGYRKNDRRLIGKPDVYVPRARLCVFVHGCFWHGCERCARKLKPATNRAFWEAKITRNRTRDAEVRSMLEADGYRVLVYWECEVKERLEAIVAEVLTATAG
ncbi:MAG: very short patch repair endonuclease [Fimbriimonadaceae bacterium]|nr:very short patch repair endonuclease [Fimbriimonadaceae bacterium]